MPPFASRLLFVLAAALTAVALAAPASAPAYPNVFCQGTVHAHGEAWGFDGHDVKCPFQKLWTYRYLRFGHRPANWRCIDLGDSGRCHRKGEATRWFEFFAED
jgi:hypothetical protein